MNRTAPGAARRSGDPRLRSEQAPRPQARSRRWTVVLAVVVALGLGVLAHVALRPASGGAADQAAEHARVACDLTAQAEESARVPSDARFAAAVLLLDHAIIESGRAAEADPELDTLVDRVRAVHAAGHEGDAAQWRTALDAALDACHGLVG